MTTTDWRTFWEKRSTEVGSDFEFDRVSACDDADVEELAKLELLRFIDPQKEDIVFDAGCGTGGNMLMLSPQVNRILGIDYSAGAVERCRNRLKASRVQNAEVNHGDVTKLEISNCSIDKVICMSVLQYLDNRDAEVALSEFARVLKPGGILILHVKNLSSLYLSTLFVAQQIRSKLGRSVRKANFRTFGWYVKNLRSLRFKITDYNSFNLAAIPKMPLRLERYLRGVELRNCDGRVMRSSVIRRFGADLKIKAVLQKP